MSKIGKEIFTVGGFSITPASPDHPIYSRGFVIGGKILKKTSGNTPENNSKPERKKE